VQSLGIVLMCIAAAVGYGVAQPKRRILPTLARALHQFQVQGAVEPAPQRCLVGDRELGRPAGVDLAARLRRGRLGQHFLKDMPVGREVVLDAASPQHVVLHARGIKLDHQLARRLGVAAKAQDPAPPRAGIARDRPQLQEDVRKRRQRSGVPRRMPRPLRPVLGR
jgi:hypothetical protein